MSGPGSSAAEFPFLDLGLHQRRYGEFRDVDSGRYTVLPAMRGLLDAGGSLVGFRRFTEEPAHSVEPLAPGVEIRRYDERVAAETTVLAEEEAARRIGFRRLAGFIFGANHAEAGRDAPTIQQTGGRRGEKIAMTAPVEQVAHPDGQWVIRFFMPREKTLATLPDPDDSAVNIIAIPAETVAVQRFSGGTDPQRVATFTRQLMRALDGSGWKAIGEPAAWFYDPPWTLPFLRRNEVSVAVQPRD